MVTYFGVSHFSVTELGDAVYSFNKNGEFEYFIKKEITVVYNFVKRINFNILDKNLTPCVIEKNGWVLEDFSSNDSYNPSYILVSFNDPHKTRLGNYRPALIGSPTIYNSEIWGFDNKALITLFDLFYTASNFGSWLDFLKSRTNLVFDYKGIPDNLIKLKEIQELNTLKEEISILKKENEILVETISHLKIKDEDSNAKIEKLKNEFEELKEPFSKFKGQTFFNPFLKLFKSNY